MGEEPNGDSYEGFQPEVDALDRFERVIDTQIATLQGIDDKAAHVTQLVTVLLGVVLTGLTLAWRVERLRIETVPLLSIGAFSVGVLFLFAALVTGIVSYLSSRYRYGIHRMVPLVIRRYRTTTPEYVELIQGSYTTAIEHNKQVIKVNVGQFEWSLSFLLLGVLYLAIGAVVLVSSPGGAGQVFVSLVAVGTSVAVVQYVPRDNLLVLIDGGFNHV